MGNGEKNEYCYIKTSTRVLIKGDMKGQPSKGTDRLKGEGFSYVCDDKSTIENQTIDISLSVGYKAASASITIPINIFKKGGKSRAEVTGSFIKAPKKGRYKAYGKITYCVTTYSTFKRPDTRGMSKKKKKKIRWKYVGKYRNPRVTVELDQSKCRYIGKYGG